MGKACIVIAGSPRKQIVVNPETDWDQLWPHKFILRAWKPIVATSLAIHNDDYHLMERPLFGKRWQIASDLFQATVTPGFVFDEPEEKLVKLLNSI